jgi:hypothetical protein
MIGRSLRFATAGVLLLSGSSCGGGGGREPGTLYFSQDDNATGLFVLNVATGLATPVGAGTTGTTSATIGLTESYDPDLLLGSTHEDVAEIATDGSGASVLAGSDETEGLAYHDPDGLLYGTINGNFFGMNPLTGEVVTMGLAVPGEDLEGLASDPRNDLIYGIGDTTILYVYDVALDSWGIVGDTTINWDSGGLAYDPDERVLYAVGEGGGDNLYRIDPDTAVATLIGPLGTAARGGLGFVRGD